MLKTLAYFALTALVLAIAFVIGLLAWAGREFYDKYKDGGCI